MSQPDPQIAPGGTQKANQKAPRRDDVAGTWRDAHQASHSTCGAGGSPSHSCCRFFSPSVPCISLILLSSLLQVPSSSCFSPFLLLFLLSLMVQVPKWKVSEQNHDDGSRIETPTYPAACLALLGYEASGGSCQPSGGDTGPLSLSLLF